jgi:hypothetical protein
MNTILAVTNERFVAESFFSQYYGTGKLSRIVPTEGDNGGRDVYAEWKTISNGEEVNNFITVGQVASEYNVIYLPYQGFAYVLARARKYVDLNQRFIIATMRESHMTPIIANDLYNIILDTRYKSGFGLFSKLFEDIGHNNLLDSEFDPVMEAIKNHEIPLLSDNIDDLLPHVEPDPEPEEDPVEPSEDPEEEPEEG